MSLAGELQVAVNVRTWIEHCGYAFGIIADQIGKLGDTVGLNAFKNERYKDSYFYVQPRNQSLTFLSSRALPMSAVMPMFERTFPGPIGVSLPQQ